jgi:hypothetical protein
MESPLTYEGSWRFITFLGSYGGVTQLDGFQTFNLA